jgi:hypothetical protein
MADEAVSVGSTQRMEEAGVTKEETGAARKRADSSEEVVVAALSVAICWWWCYSRIGQHNISTFQCMK